VSGIGIRSNLASQIAQRRLADSSSALERVYERLSSGQRINRASDDAAGLAVADKLGAERRLFIVAQRNIGDGLSALGIMDSSVTQQSTILTRLAELSEQSANGTYGSAQRGNLDKEYQQLVRELGRLGDSTEFNGQSLLLAGRRGQASSLSLQAGINSSSNSIISLQGYNTGSWSGNFDISRYATFDWNQDGIFPQDGDLDAFGEAQDLDTLLQRFNHQAAVLEVQDSAGNTRRLVIGLVAQGNTFSPVSFLENSDTGLFEVTGASYIAYSELYAGNTGSYSFNESTGKINGDGSISVDTGLGSSILLDLSGLSFRDSSAGNQTSAIDFTSVATVEAARNALTAVRSRQDELNSIRGSIGATQSRLESALLLAFTSGETRAQAESRIRDADIGAESANLSRLQILQQAGAAVLAQANQQPQLALTLLRG
jgi:flagellin